jgi:hypothetical protein
MHPTKKKYSKLTVPPKACLGKALMIKHLPTPGLENPILYQLAHSLVTILSYHGSLGLITIE